MKRVSGSATMALMDDLGKVVRGEWFDISEALDDPYAMEDVFGYSPSELKTLVGELRGAVEGGVTEFKLSALARFFTFMETLKYDSKGFETLLAQAGNIRQLIYVMLYQRYIALKIIGPHKQRVNQDAAQDQADGLSLKEIINDVNQRLVKDMSLKSNASVKNILMQIQIYRKELDQMNKLLPNIPKEKVESFKGNYRNTFDAIVNKVRTNYANLTRDEIEANIKDKTELTPIQRYDLSELGSIYLNQAKEASTLHATVTFSIKERYKTREVLTGLMPRQALFKTLIQREMAGYQKNEGERPGPDSLSRAFISELCRIYTRQADRGV